MANDLINQAQTGLSQLTQNQQADAHKQQAEARKQIVPAGQGTPVQKSGNTAEAGSAPEAATLGVSGATVAGVTFPAGAAHALGTAGSANGAPNLPNVGVGRQAAASTAAKSGGETHYSDLATENLVSTSTNNRRNALSKAKQLMDKTAAVDGLKSIDEEKKKIAANKADAWGSFATGMIGSVGGAGLSAVGKNMAAKGAGEAGKGGGLDALGQGLGNIASQGYGAISQTFGAQHTANQAELGGKNYDFLSEQGRSNSESLNQAIDSADKTADKANDMVQTLIQRKSELSQKITGNS